MFGRRLKNDGFDWHKYVRTTIILRREDRRKRIEDMRLSALGLPQNALLNIVSAVSFVLALSRSLLSTLFFSTWEFLRRATGWLFSIFCISGHYFFTALHDGLPILKRPGLLPLLALTCLVAASSAVARIATLGWDWHAIIAFGFAALFGLLTVASALASLPHLVRLPFNGRHSGFASFFTGRRVVAGILAGAFGTAAVVGAVGHDAPTQISTWFHQKIQSFNGFPTVAAQTVQGVAKAITGDTLKINGTIIKLAKLEAPELTQLCKTARGTRWRCGRRARTALARLTGYKSVICEVSTYHKGYIKTGSCNIEGADIGATLVQKGYVFADGGTYARYAAHEKEAQKTKSGVWRGTAERPETYRQSAWQRAQKKSPDGCPIKAHLSQKGKKTYLLPWAPNYRKKIVNRRKGEGWFCTEKEAIAAGWSPDPSG